MRADQHLGDRQDQIAVQHELDLDALLATPSTETNSPQPEICELETATPPPPAATTTVFTATT